MEYKKLAGNRRVRGARPTISLFLIIFLVAVSLSGCSSKKTKELGPREAVIEIKPPKVYRDVPSVAGTPLKTIEEARKSTLSLIKAYLETAFLNLNSAKSADYKEQVFALFDKKSRPKFEKNFATLSLGAEGKSINAILGNKLQLELIVINYDKSKKPSLSTVKIDNFDVKYKTGKKVFKLNISGWLAAERQGSEWKIFDYRLKQTLN